METKLDGFNWQDYQQYLPTEEPARSNLISKLEERKYGWKRIAYLLIALAKTIVEATEYQGSLKSRIEALGTKTRKQREMKIDPRAGLRAYLESRSTDELQTLCLRHDVSYASFMNSNDKVGLIEAILDEMTAEKVS